MNGSIWTPQKCPACGEKYPTSDGGFPIICETCRTQPSKYVIKVRWQGRPYSLSHDREGRTIHHWNHASNLLGQIRSEIQARTFDPEIYKKLSATAFAVFWQKFQAKYQGSPATYAKIDVIGRTHLDALKGFQMRDIRAYHIDEWWEGLKAKELSPHYMNDIHQWVKRFFSEAQVLDVIDKVPHFPSTLKEPVREIEWYTQEEQDAVFAGIPEHDRPIFEFLFLTGCRVSEAIALHRADVDMHRGRTILSHTVRRDGSIGPTKNKKPRVIPHGPELEDCLRRAMKVGNLNRVVFLNQWGRRYSDDYLRDTCRRAALDAGLKPIPLKNITRHSWGMQRIEDGVDIWTLSKAYNHSSIKMTERYVEMVSDKTAGLYARRTRADRKTTRKITD